MCSTKRQAPARPIKKQFASLDLTKTFAINFAERPLHVRKDPYIEKWEDERHVEINKLTS